jgi:hypothetical protein
MLTRITPDAIALQSQRVYPLGVRLYLNATSPSIERIRWTGVEVHLTDARRTGRTRFDYTGTVRKATPAIVDWLEQVQRQGSPTAANAATFVALHLDRRRERRTYKTFQVMSPDILGYKATTCDLSQSGLRLTTPVYVAPHSQLRMTLQFDDYNFPPVEVRGQVVWCQERGREGFWVGMQFVDLGDETRAHIAHYIDFAEGYKSRRFRGA